jgi:hypothetical protein
MVHQEWFVSLFEQSNALAVQKGKSFLLARGHPAGDNRAAASLTVAARPYRNNEYAQPSAHENEVVSSQSSLDHRYGCVGAAERGSGGSPDRQRQHIS